MRKKFLEVIVCALLLCCAVLVFAACDNAEEEHVHSYSEQWSSDEEYHWHDLTCGHDYSWLISEYKGKHEFVDGKCEVCNYEPKHTVGIRYSMIDEQSGYEVAGLGSATDTDIVFASEYMGLPVTKISVSAFEPYKYNGDKDAQERLSKIRSVYIPDSVVEIGSSAFEDCVSLEEVKLSSTSKLKTIGSHAFRNTALKSFVIPDGVEEIPRGAFPQWSLESITFGKNVKYFDMDNFGDSLENVYYTGTISDWCDIEFWSDSFVAYYSGQVDGANPLEGKGNLYIDNQLVTKLVIPDDVTEIKSYAFRGANFKEIVVPSNVTKINAGAFLECNQVEKITLPFVGGGLIGEESSWRYEETSPLFGYIFGYDESSPGFSYTYTYYIPETLKEVVITGGDKICNSAFGDKYIYRGNNTDRYYQACGKIEKITIPETVTEIGDNAFDTCYGLKEINFPEALTKIGDYAFEGADLEKVTIPKNVTEIGFGAFQYLDKLRNIYWYAENIQTVEDRAFNGCATSVTDWNGVILTIANNVEKFPISIQCFELSEVYFEKDSICKSIGDEAFMKCKKLLSINLPSTLESIGASAFEECHSLITIALPSNLTVIDKDAFKNCYKLIEICNLSSLDVEAGSKDCGRVAENAKNVYGRFGGSKLHSWDGFIFYNDNNTYYLMGRGDTYCDELVLPDAVYHTGVVIAATYKVHSYAFAYRKDTSITLPKAIVEIGEEAILSSDIGEAYFEYVNWRITIYHGGTYPNEENLSDPKLAALALKDQHQETWTKR